jgi:hypothetical protein
MNQKCRVEICKSDYQHRHYNAPWWCASCWSKVDMDNLDWPGLANHDLHTWEGIDLDHSQGPWRHYNYRCALRCKHGYWSNFETGSNRVDADKNPHEQQCSSNNCLKWNWRLATENPTRCSECFQSTDVSNYNYWVAKASYPRINISNMDRSHPFSLDQNTKKCILRCLPGSWVENSDCNSKYIEPDGTVICKNIDQDPLKQSCVSDNCKSWEGRTTWCTKCWDKYDLAHYDSWLGRGSYSRDNVKGSDTDIPFALESKQCKLQCRDGHYSFATEFILEQKCLKCEAPCHSCSGTPTNCTWCGSTGFLVPTEPSNGSQTCGQCDANCRRCDSDPRKCTECWLNSELTTALPDWKGLSTYHDIDPYDPTKSTLKEIYMGRNPLAAFETPADNNMVCKINCNLGYYFFAADPDDPYSQSCKKCGPNCKGCIFNGNNCSVCWANADIRSTWAPRQIHLVYSAAA